MSQSEKSTIGTVSPARVTAGSVAMIERLVGFDTTSRNSNLELIHDVETYLSKLGVSSQLSFDDSGKKANLYATVGPAGRGGIALSGHSDVVPVDGQNWSSDPWTVRHDNSRLYGRGTCDMKGFIAVALSHVPRFLEADLQIPIHLCLSFDEEVDCGGAKRLMTFLQSQDVVPLACVIGEPTEMQVVTAHKGGIGYRCDVRGLECHSSLAPQGVNAVQAAARMIAQLDEMARRRAVDGPFDYDYDVPHTTIQAGVIQGGTALNIVPKDCSFEFEFRNLPDDDISGLFAEVTDFARTRIEPDMKAIEEACGFSWQELCHYPAFSLAEDSDLVTLVKSCAQANATTKVAFSTEAGCFQSQGIATIICGPGSIAQAHKPDEFITLEQLGACEAFMGRLIERLSNPGIRDLNF
ncbi:acetylornithine deacetylase [Pelagibius sp. Alg239-R121]|uniref:acetylornithine deacetylase n=1 Tax=Pelagibius sp. Alg239-R121 TaxID=2993448 RepID=UPI0024A75402|nr:acetylornithine deacetylase [Pelagibius sp. Alg239-R121]